MTEVPEMKEWTEKPRASLSGNTDDLRGTKEARFTPEDSCGHGDAAFVQARGGEAGPMG